MNYKYTIQRRRLGIGTCPRMHEHGDVVVTLTYCDFDPLVLHVRATFTTALMGQFDAVHQLYRESVHNWLRDAPAGALLTLGEASLKVRKSAPHVVCVQLPRVEVGQFGVKPMFMINRSWLQDFTNDTYVAVSADREFVALDVDACIEQLLNSR